MATTMLNQGERRRLHQMIEAERFHASRASLAAPSAVRAIPAAAQAHVAEDATGGGAATIGACRRGGVRDEREQEEESSRGSDQYVPRAGIHDARIRDRRVNLALLSLRPSLAGKDPSTPPLVMRTQSATRAQRTHPPDRI